MDWNIVFVISVLMLISVMIYIVINIRRLRGFYNYYHNEIDQVYAKRMAALRSGTDPHAIPYPDRHASFDRFDGTGIRDWDFAKMIVYPHTGD